MKFPLQITINSQEELKKLLDALTMAEGEGCFDWGDKSFLDRLIHSLDVQLRGIK